MNYNENTFNTMPTNSNRRLTRRPMETPGLGVNSIPSQQPQYNYAQQSMYSQPDTQSMPTQQQFYYNDFTSAPSQPQHGYGNNDFGFSGSMPMDNINHRQHYVPSPGPSPQPTQPTMFIPSNNIVDAFGNNPILAGATVRYGQKILGQVVDEKVGKYTSGIGAQIKRYFAVDTRYVISKLGLLLFPFAHTDWSIMLETSGDQTDDRRRARPKTDINAPDLYIPTVAFVTYLLLLGLILGKQGQFSPELLSVQASRVLAWELIIVAVEILSLYVTNIQSSLRVLDLMAYSGYKYFGIICCVPIGLLLGETVFYIILLYTGIAFTYFLLFSMRWQLNSVATVATAGQPVVMVEYKRKRTLYFLILAVAIQPLTMWYLISYLTLAMR